MTHFPSEQAVRMARVIDTQKFRAEILGWQSDAGCIYAGTRGCVAHQEAAHHGPAQSHQAARRSIPGLAAV